MNVDWENIAESAKNSPRGMLSELLAEVDEIEAVVMLVLRKAATEDTPTEVGVYSTIRTTEALGLCEYGRGYFLKELTGGAG